VVSTRGTRPTPCPGALTVRLASVTWDNALGDFGGGADVGEHGQNFGLTTHLFSTKLSVPKAHLLAWRTPSGGRPVFIYETGWEQLLHGVRR
jgi:hypothetical protein